MVLGNENLHSEEQEITKILISIICLYGNDGLPLDRVNDEFESYCGYAIPYKKFGSETLRSWILTLPNIYIVLDDQNNEVLIQQSPKSTHIKELILRQKPNSRYQPKRKNYDSSSHTSAKRHKTFELGSIPQKSFYHSYEKPVEHIFAKKNPISQSLVHNNKAADESTGFDKFEQLECMLPLLYKHQALGDDFFIDIADTKLGYYVPERGPKECGLCAAGQTIYDLTQKIQNAEYLAPRVVVMIGFEDLLLGRTVKNMISDLRQLVLELKKRNTRVTLITLIPSPKLPNIRKLQIRMDIYNKAILDYACDDELKCNVIDMYTIFLSEEENFRRDYDRFTRVAKKDPYKVFSDYGRKIFLNALKSCLREQIEVGH